MISDKGEKQKQRSPKKRTQAYNIIENRICHSTMTPQPNFTIIT
jgi:hypothetical protein